MRIPPSPRRATQLALFQLSPGAGRLPQRQTVAFLGRGSGVGRHCVPSGHLTIGVYPLILRAYTLISSPYRREDSTSGVLP